MKESTFFHRNKEILLGIFMILIAAFYLYHSTFIKTRSSVSVSARLIPEILGCLVLILGVAQIVSGVRYLREARRLDAENGAKPSFFSKDSIANARPIILTFVIILLYAIAFEPVGFLISSILCMFSLMWVLTPKALFKPGKFALICVIVAVVVYIAFKRGLDLALPGGILEGLPLL